MSEFARGVLVDPAKLDYLRIQKGWTIDEIPAQSDALLQRKREASRNGPSSGHRLSRDYAKNTITKNTILAIGKGKRVHITTARVLAELFGISDVTHLIDKSSLPPVGPPGTWGSQRGPFTELSDWEIERFEGMLPRKVHGIAAELWRVRHKFTPDRAGRGKVYHTDALSSKERARIREYLVRHADVCNRLSGHPSFPRNLTCAPDTNNQCWWVVDEWIEGETLEDRLAAGEPDLREAARILKMLASALHALHRNDIVRRDLSPEDVLLREGDGSVILTDLELSKILENRPTVAPDDWWEYENPLRAPELGSPDSIVPAVDVYSWGRLFVRLVCGSYPEGLARPEFPAKTGIPPALLDLVSSAASADRRKRPESFEPVITALEKWIPR